LGGNGPRVKVWLRSFRATLSTGAAARLSFVPIFSVISAQRGHSNFVMLACEVLNQNLESYNPYHNVLSVGGV